MISMTSTTEKQFGVKTRSRRLKDNDEPEILTKKRRVHKNGSTEKTLDNIKPTAKCRNGRARIQSDGPALAKTKLSGNGTTLPHLSEEDDKQLEDCWELQAKGGCKNLTHSKISNPLKPTTNEKVSKHVTEEGPEKKIEKAASGKDDGMEAADDFYDEPPFLNDRDMQKGRSFVVDTVSKPTKDDLLSLEDSEDSWLGRCEPCDKKYDKLFEQFQKLQEQLETVNKKNKALQADNKFLEGEIDKVYLEYGVKPKEEQL
ncbi:hypothetical protein QR680_019322 [Steinernema hermaphroditum]|uniref:Uncharacterized protein n=1 Tax=Steinernema hermaphroditum TaxID=289476 RepID=A0AA39LAR2_9BILA|nr:hypothetical protein QR680_019322 [Steinernema hermaphroditum]